MDNIFFFASKIIWTLMRPETWLILIICFAFFALQRNSPRAATSVITAALGICIMIAVFPLGSLVLRPLETRFVISGPLTDIDGIIILGGAENAVLSRFWAQPQLNSSAERLLTGIALARRFPNAVLVYTGGSGSILSQTDRGAAVVNQIFLSQGIKSNRIVIESQSRNTAENAILSHKLIQPQEDQQWILVTSASHMPRSVGVFCQAGWSVLPYPVDYRSGAFIARIGWNFAHNLDDLNVGVKEWVGLLAYWLTGKTPSLLPNSC